MKKLITVPDARITLGSLSFGGGNAPSYTFPENTADILETFQKIEGVFKENGTFDPAFKKAESYALCLVKDGKKDTALELFDLIVGNSEKLLKKKSDGFQMVANKSGELGVEGIHQYAELLKAAGRKEGAKKLFFELVDNYPLNLGIRAVDIANEAIIEIIQNNLYPFGRKNFYKKKRQEIGADVW